MTDFMASSILLASSTFSPPVAVAISGSSRWSQSCPARVMRVVLPISRWTMTDRCFWRTTPMRRQCIHSSTCFWNQSAMGLWTTGSIQRFPLGFRPAPKA